MHAGAQDLVGFRDIGIGELREREFGFHVADISSIRPRLRMILGSKPWRTRWPSAATPAACGWKTSIARQSARTPGSARHGRRPPRRADAPAPARPASAATPPEIRPPQSPITSRRYRAPALTERAAGSRRTDDPGQPTASRARRRRQRARRRGWHPTPQPRRRPAACPPTEWRQRPGQRGGAVRHRGGDAFEPQQRGRPPRKSGERAAAGRNAEFGKCAAPETS